MASLGLTAGPALGPSPLHLGGDQGSHPWQLFILGPRHPGWAGHTQVLSLCGPQCLLCGSPQPPVSPDPGMLSMPCVLAGPVTWGSAGPRAASLSCLSPVPVILGDSPGALWDS